MLQRMEGFCIEKILFRMCILLPRFIILMCRHALANVLKTVFAFSFKNKKQQIFSF